jgi:tetratricopeptide (TPR) repeat protein
MGVAMAADDQASYAKENQILRRFLEDALIKAGQISAQARAIEAGASDEDAPGQGTSPHPPMPPEVTRDFGGDARLENEALHRALAATQFQLYRNAEHLRMDDRRTGSAAMADAVARPGPLAKSLRAVGMLYHDIIALVGPSARLVTAANRARDAQDFAQAAHLYAQACAAMPGHFRLWVQQGNMAKDAGLFQQAQQAYETARSLQGDNADLHLQMGHLCKMVGDLAGAAHAYCLALSCAPTTPTPIASWKRWDMRTRPIAFAPGQAADPFRPSRTSHGAQAYLGRWTVFPNHEQCARIGRYVAELLRAIHERGGVQLVISLNANMRGEAIAARRFLEAWIPGVDIQIWFGTANEAETRSGYSPSRQADERILAEHVRALAPDLALAQPVRRLS